MIWVRKVSFSRRKCPPCRRIAQQYRLQCVLSLSEYIIRWTIELVDYGGWFCRLWTHFFLLRKTLQFHLYCDNAWVPEFITTMQGLGCLVGALIWGQLGELFGRRWASANSAPFVAYLFVTLLDSSHHLRPRRCRWHRWQLCTELATCRRCTFLHRISRCWLLEHLLCRLSRNYSG